MTEPRAADQLEQPRANRRGAGADVLVVLGGLLVLGIVCGVLWWLLVDPAVYTKVRAGAAMGEVQLGKRFATDGWYAVIAFVAAVPTGAALTWWRSRDPLLTAALLVVGSALAAAAMALSGHLLGPGDPHVALVAGKVGIRVPTQLSVTATTAYLAWPIGLLAGSLLVLWSSPAEPRG
jgi:hypothetical protein